MNNANKENEIIKLKEKFQNEIQTANWSMLKEHFQKGNLLIISNELDLVTVSIHIATDNVSKIKEYQNSEQIKIPTKDQVVNWENPKSLKNGLEPLFQFLIIQPFVIIQLSHSSLSKKKEHN